MDGAHYREWLELPPPTLMARLGRGHSVSAAQIAGHAYKGISLGLPHWIERVTWKKFRKVFVHDGVRGVVRGWNERVEQDDLGAPCRPRMRGGAVWRFGHFRVLDATLAELPSGCIASALLDYGAGHPAWHPLSRMRDPLVALEPGATERLLGWSYLDAGLVRVPTPSFFLLEREGPAPRGIEPEHWR